MAQVASQEAPLLTSFFSVFSKVLPIATNNEYDPFSSPPDFQLSARHAKANRIHKSKIKNILISPSGNNYKTCSRISLSLTNKSAPL